jgi:hypothetical protein
MPKPKGVKELLQYRKNFEPLSPKKAIKAFCADCMGEFEDKELRDCDNPRCPLYPHMPYNKKNRDNDKENDNTKD